MDDFDFDFDEFAGFGDFDIGDVDLSSFNWDDILSDIDLSDFDFSDTDLSNLILEDVGGGIAGGMSGAEDLIGDTSDIFGADEGAGTVVITGEQPTDLSGFDLSTADQVYQGTDTRTGFDFDTADQVYQGSNLGTDPYEIDGLQGSREDTYEEDLKDKFWKDLITEDEGAGTVTITGTKPTGEDEDDDDENPPVVCQPGSERKVPQPDGSTWVYNCKGELIDKLPPTKTPDPKCPPNSNTLETLPDGTKIVKDCKGNILSVTKPTGPGTTTTTGTDWDKWAALLGGLLGLLGRKTETPATYKGGIPKYVATRGPSRSPTEGGRRPGGAGIGSLTGGVTYTPVGAAYGGLMGLSSGGKPRTARYLAGGTDGMADKIQTSIDGKQPARLSHGEFVIPADVVSHLGNGNSDAGANVLYDMMAKVRKDRTGNPRQGKQINPRKYIPK